jgi:hypothetical protein
MARGIRVNNQYVLEYKSKKGKKTYEKKDIHWVNTCSCSISLNDNERWCNSVDKYYL